MLILLSVETVTSAALPYLAWIIAAIDCTVVGASSKPWVRAATRPTDPMPVFAAVLLPMVLMPLVRSRVDQPVLSKRPVPEVGVAPERPAFERPPSVAMVPWVAEATATRIHPQ